MLSLINATMCVLSLNFTSAAKDLQQIRGSTLFVAGHHFFVGGVAVPWSRLLGPATPVALSEQVTGHGKICCNFCLSF
jgi:hypothetical protein